MALNLNERTETPPRRSSRIVRYLFLVVSVAFGLWVAELPKGNRVPPAVESQTTTAAPVAPAPPPASEDSAPSETTTFDPSSAEPDSTPLPPASTDEASRNSSRLRIGWSTVSIQLPRAAVERARRTDDGSWPIPESWEEVVAGVEVAKIESQEPRPLKAWLVRIDLTSPQLQFVATPSNGDQAGETSGRLTSTFLTEFECELAINAGPYSPILAVEGQAQEISGLQIAGGVVVSKADSALPVLWQNQQGEWGISEPTFDVSTARLAVPGFERVLIAGDVTGKDLVLHPRTAAGISADRQSMIWMIVDGRQAGRSEGATTRELGEWLLALGMSEGINLDGGGTTTLVRRADNELGYEVLNRPIHGGIPGLQRISASHLGLKVAGESQ